MALAADYTIVAEARGQRVLWFRRFGSYQGEWLLLSADESRYYVYKDWYGSCSGCDAIEGGNLGTCEIGDPHVEAFIKDYRPFLQMDHAAATRVAMRDGNLLSVLPANRRDYLREDVVLGDLDADGNAAVGRQLALCVLVESDAIRPLEILEIDNLEGRREAIDRYGVAAWVNELGAKMIDQEGPDELWSLERGEDREPYVFLYLKDGSTDRRYVLRVAPGHMRVRAARAASFGMEPDRFVLAAET